MTVRVLQTAGTASSADQAPRESCGHMCPRAPHPPTSSVRPRAQQHRGATSGLCHAAPGSPDPQDLLNRGSPAGIHQLQGPLQGGSGCAPGALNSSDTRA